MVRTSVLNDALNAMNNAEKAGRRQVLIRPSSKVIIKFLHVMQKHGTFIFLHRHGYDVSETCENGGGRRIRTDNWMNVSINPRRLSFKCPIY